MAYSQQSWNTGDPITQEKMRKIEKGIYDAHVMGDSSINSVTNLNAALSELSTTVSNQASAIRQAQIDIASAQHATEDGTNAWTQIYPLLEFEEDGTTVRRNLATRITTDEGHISDNANLIATVQGWVNDAKSVGGQVYDAVNARFKNADSLAERIGEINRLIENVTNTANSTQQTISPTNGRSFADRLTSIDANQVPTRTLISIIEEIENAHVSAQHDTIYSNIDARLEADELSLNTHASQIGALDESRVKYTDVKNNFESSDIDKPLSAAKGKELKDTIGGSYGPSSTVAAGITAAQSAAESNAQSYADTHKVDKNDIYNGVDHTADDQKVLDARVGKTLQDAIDTINTGLNTAETGLVARVSAAEEAISHTASGADNGGLTERLTQAESNIDTIASELSMYNTQTGAIEATNSRVATIEENVVAIGKEIGMLQDDAAVQDLSTAVSRANTRVDAIEDEINAAHRTLASGTDTLDDRFDDIESAISHPVDVQTDDAGGLTERLTAVEGDINTTTTGIKARITANENDIDTIKSDLNTATTGLKARVTALESEPKSATVIISADRITYNVETGLPTIYTDNTKTTAVVPTQDADYLLQAADEKYYYWKYIGTAPNGSWKLISGGGGSGSGNTSGFDLTAAEYDAIENYAENTDYYVLESDGIRHHYRYIPNSEDPTVLDEIEIGLIVDTSKIKRYNIATENATVDGEEVTYLNLYQYDYEELNNNVDTERTPLTQIILPKGGGSGAISSSVNKLIRIGDQTIQKIVGSQILLRVFYSSWDSSGTESSSGDYTLKTGNTTIASGVFNSGAADADLTQGWQDNTAGYYEFDVTDYCSVGNTSFTLAVAVNGTTLGKSWTVNIIDLHLESTAPDVLLINSSESYNFPYTPFGALSKTLYVIIDDDTEHATTASLFAVTSGRTAQVTIPAQAHGAHKIELYLEATVGGVLQRTESIVREYIWYNEASDVTILASPKNEQTITAQQYSTIEIPYQVYKKDATSITLEYYVDDAVTPFDTITLEDTNTGVLSYLAATQGTHTVTIKVHGENVSVSTTLNITELSIDVSPISGAIIDFDPTMLTNSSTNRLPSWTVGNNTYSLTASDNFNWSDDASGGGYKTDVDGKCFVIKAGSYIDLNYPMFAGNGSNNILTNGAEMKIIFKTEAVRDINAVWFQNTGTLTEKTVGIQLGAHFGWLKTDKATDTTTTAAGTEYDAWVSGTAYVVDAIVLYKDAIYKCIKACVDHTDVIPGTTAGADYWTVLTGDDIPSDTTGIAAWATGTAYAKDVIVSYNTAYYKCKKAVTNELTTNPKDGSSNWLSMGKIDTEVLATNSYLYFPYSEEDKIELDININKYNANADTNFIMSYEDGVPSKAYAYEYGAAGDGLYHSNTIRIGSNDCDVYLYRLRIYNKSLDTDDILQNFIADGNGINEKVSRYNRNCIYWDSTQEKFFTSPSATAMLDPIKLAERMPDVKILMLDTPTFTTGKKNFVYGSNLRCLQADGGTVYPSRGDADNWFFMNGFHAGQGTTSDNYGQSARNVDFLFEVDGVNYPTKKKNMGGYTPSNEYVSQVLVGKTASTWNGTTWEGAREPTTNEICDDWKGDKCKVALTESSVPNNYFNLKVNVASSENVNNALFQKRYNDFLTYNSPAQAAQIAKHRTAYTALGMNPNKIKVKNDMEFIPAVLFVRENDITQDGNGNYTKHNEFNDTNWHFYALGNIGDSKKTDYTRAYDPDDMNEFTCENSDNNTNNGQFQSGVFTYNGHRAIETPYDAYDAEETYAEGAIVVNDGVIQVYDGEAWSNATLTGWTDETTPYFAPFTAPNPMEYIYPITSSEWNVKLGDNYVNYKHHTLVTEEFDGDHSFEFRYACRGDYRDGDLINESDGQDDDAQFDLNHDVMLAFYEWLITSTEEQYAAEAPQWFVKSAMEFFYAFTHYYTMMDNRAKNTFWHFAKTGTYIEASRPVKELLHIYEESSDDGTTWTAATGTEIDPNKRYRTQYAFDLWTYDCDTAAGIDNNGALVFPYGKEDTDYRTEGDPLSGYAFNGAGSIFWRRLRTTFASEIIDTMSSTDVNCFNSQDLIDEFDQFQNCFPEEIWRLDIERKYIRTFTGESIDNSITTGKQNPRFLTSMMQGRKKYQRRQWIRDQGVYFNSKYRLADITSNSNTIEFNCTTPANIENIALTPSYYLQLTPYQDMYLNVQVGNGNYKDSYITPDGSKNLRAKAGQTYTFNLSGNYQETRIYINGANHLSAIGNLAAMYPYSFDLRALAHIKTLDIGTNVDGYVNTKFTELKLPTYMPLLESLNIKNCHSVAGTIGLSTANNIRNVEATGTAITGVSLPDYTNIQTLHVPSTVTAINLYGARQLTDFKVYDNDGTLNYGALYKLHLYDSDYSSNIDWIDIATEMLTKQSLETEISFLRMNVATIGNIQEMAPFAEFKEELEDAGGVMNFTGTIHVTGDYSDVEKETYEDTWPGLTMDVSGGTLKQKYKVTYKYDDYIDNNGNTVHGEEIKTLYISRGDPVIDIWQYTDNNTQELVHMLEEMPHRDSTVRKTYQFGLRSYGSYLENSGWRQEGQSQPMSQVGVPTVTSNMTIYTYFKEEDALYDIKWYLRKNLDGTPRASTLVKTSANPVPYGGGADEEAPTVMEIHSAGLETATAEVNGGQVNYSIFKGWEKLPVNITPTVAEAPYCIYAQWEEGSIALIDLFADTSALTPTQLLVLSALNDTGRANYTNNAAAIGSKVTYTLGHDSAVSGTELIGPNASRQILRLDLPTTTVLNTAVQPMAAANDAFTIAIDYCLDANAEYNSQYKAGILASCYSVNSSANTISGFALYHNLNTNLNDVGPRVGFGDMFSASAQSVPVGSSTNIDSRNMVVLRHPAGSSVLYVYSGITSEGAISPNIIAQQVPWNNSTNDAYLVFGQVTNNTSNDYTSIKSITTRAKGTIYWAKYWPSDLGIGECKRIASWPHEEVTFAFSTIESYATVGDRAIGSAPSPALGLTTVSTLSHGKVIHGNIRGVAGQTYGWGTSPMRSVCNGALLLGLPIQLQSIICKMNTAYYNMAPYVDNSMTYQPLASVPSYIRDYIALPSARSLGNASSTNDYDAEENNDNLEPYTWLADNTSVAVYNYDPNTTGSWASAADANRALYLNLRFPDYALNWSTENPLRIFRITSATIPSSSTIYTEINKISGGIKTGDIYISDMGIAYVYITDNDITVKGLQNEPNSGIFTTNSGGWLKASEYWTRSMGYGQNQNNFVYVDTASTLVLSETRSASNAGLSLNYTIAI